MTLARSITFNALGILLPLVAAVLSIPLLISNIGLSKFGTYSLLMAGIGYLGFLDLGLGVAVTYRLSTMIATGRPDTQILNTSKVALTTVLLLGLLLTILVWFVSPIISPFMTDSTSEIVGETLAAIRILGLSIPFAFASSLLNGILSAFNKFDQINLVRAPIGALTYLIPAAASIWYPSLSLIAAIFLVLRVASSVLNFLQCCRLIPCFSRKTFLWDSRIFNDLISYGGWLTVSNVIGPIMTVLDRFYIGIIRDANEVARYVAPYEIASRLLLIPGSVLPVFFPRMVSNRLIPKKRSPKLLHLLTLLIVLLCAIPAILVSVFAPLLVKSWMGEVFKGDSTLVLQILISGAFVNCVSLVYFYDIQAAAKTDLIAKIHLIELGPYVFFLWFLTKDFGIIGAALVWAGRVAIDALLLCWVVSRDDPMMDKVRGYGILGLILLAATLIGGVSYLPSVYMLLIIPFVIVVVCVMYLKTLLSIFEIRVRNIWRPVR